MPILKVNENEKFPRPYWPKELVNKRYSGNMEIVEGDCVLVIPKPGADCKDIAKNLRRLAQMYQNEDKIDPRLSELELNDDGQLVRKELGPKKLGRHYIYYDPSTKKFRLELVTKKQGNRNPAKETK